MPIYTYKCRRCGRQFDKLQKVDEEAPVCPACGGPVNRVYQPVGIIFKGSGFYKTDYAADNRRVKKNGEKEKKPAAKKDKKVDKSTAEI